MARLYRLAAAFMPLGAEDGAPLSVQRLARRYGRGNVRLQTGRVMSRAEYEARKERVLRHAFAKI